MFSTTLEQWMLLESIIETGSIAKAAEKHCRSQPSVSYQINQLQERLGVKLLELKGRNLVLTTIGSKLLEQASLLLREWQDLEQQAQALTDNSRHSISLVIDSLFPKSRLFNALKEFNNDHPYTQVHVKEIVRDEGVLQIDKGIGDLYVVSVPDDYKHPKTLTASLTFILVAHSSHEIMQIDESKRTSRLYRYPTIQIVDKENQTIEHNENHYGESWYFTSVNSAIEAVVNQLGIGWLPETEIKHLLDEGVLQRIEHTNETERITKLYCIRSAAEKYDQCIQSLANAILR
ncbi:LysR family transcriptional regulator [Vibrio viridaestus]|uniref:LysR family transcriptional regulator n=1 Tax=Vibrio viridaestus TaxID=2487322 RepID=A0A3N9TK02_9VIBR|nr:LysR family transcriptional regulator [Vibrio viridaestus]RQW64501.1 LysR family transcriptional regulator [Vibrio viridaestus]